MKISRDEKFAPITIVIESEMELNRYHIPENWQPPVLGEFLEE